MVDDEVRDGSRIAALLSSEVHGHERGALGHLSVVDADRDAEPTAGGTFAYAVAYEPPGAADATGADDEPATDDESGTGAAPGADDAAGGSGGAAATGDRERNRIAEVYLHPERIHVEFSTALEAALDAAGEQGLPVARGGGGPPEDRDRSAVAVVVQNGAAVKPALRVVRAVAEALDEEVGEA